MYKKFFFEVKSIASKLFIIQTVIYSTLLSICYAHTSEYIRGYVSCITNESIPNERIDIHIQGEALKIYLLERDIDLKTKSKLLHRLKATSLFQQVDISFNPLENTAESAKGINTPKPYELDPAVKILPAGVIYDSPIADPKWPRFSAGYQKQLKNIYGKSIFNLSFGENLSLIRYKTNQWQYELGVQAGLFGIMNINSFPTKLINSDYFVGVGISVNYEKAWQNLFQFSHLSSHLGDEFLISRPDYINKRINLSYEAFKWFTAYKFNCLRPYIGFGYLVHRDPASIKPFTLEGGVDYISNTAFLFNSTRFVAGLHTYFWSESKFKPSLNVRTGLQLSNPVWRGRHLQFLIDYSLGKSRHGQFYMKNEHYIGFLIAVSN